MKNGKEERSSPIGIQQFWMVFFLFFMTGLAIVIYLNQTPMQPRERDYAYAGSFYAYAIWCGLGVLAIIDLLKEECKLQRYCRTSHRSSHHTARANTDGFTDLG